MITNKTVVLNYLLIQLFPTVILNKSSWFKHLYMICQQTKINENVSLFSLK